MSFPPPLPPSFFLPSPSRVDSLGTKEWISDMYFVRYNIYQDFFAGTCALHQRLARGKEKNMPVKVLGDIERNIPGSEGSGLCY